MRHEIPADQDHGDCRSYRPGRESAFPAALRQSRQHRGLTQENVANGIGCSRDHLSDVETGKRLPDIAIIEMLEQYYAEIEMPLPAWEAMKLHAAYLESAARYAPVWWHTCRGNAQIRSDSGPRRSARTSQNDTNRTKGGGPDDPAGEEGFEPSIA